MRYTINQINKGEDELILNAISYHTTGRPKMTNLEKIVFVADYIEPHRKKLPNLNEIRQVAFKDMDIKPHQFVSYVNPERPIPDRITSLTGITNYRVSDAPTIEEVLPLFLAFLHTNVIVAHNASFDMRFLKSNVNMLGLPEPQNKVIDTVFLAKKYMKHAPNHKLETLKRMLGIRLSSHNAFDDCITCAAVYQKCAAIEEEGKRKVNKAMLDETAVYEAVKEGWEPHYAVIYEDVADELEMLAHMFKADVRRF